jgi:hypothetical protein
MTHLVIATSGQFRDLKLRREVPKPVLSSYLIHIKSNEGFFCYKNKWYNTADFKIPGEGPFEDWHGHLPVNRFSGILIEYNHRRKGVKIGTYYS